MNEIKRRLMHDYVELMDGTFAKEVNGELIPVHEDEASAFEPGIYIDEDDICVSCLHERVNDGEATREELEQYSKSATESWRRGLGLDEEDDMRVSVYYGAKGLVQSIVRKMTDEELVEATAKFEEEFGTEDVWFIAACEELKRREAVC